MAAPAEGPHLGARKDPAGPQGLHCGRAAVTLLCCISEHQCLPRACTANPMGLQGKHGALYPASLALACCSGQLFLRKSHWQRRDVFAPG